MKVINTIKKGYETKEIYTNEEDMTDLIEFNILREDMGKAVIHRRNQETITVFEYKFCGDFYRFIYNFNELVAVEIYRYKKVF